MGGREADRHYAAALLEAKASVYRGSAGITISVTDTDERPLRWLQERYGGHCGRHNNGGVKACWRWRVRERDNPEAPAGVIADVIDVLRFRAAEFSNPPPPRPDRGARTPEDTDGA